MKPSYTLRIGITLLVCFCVFFSCIELKNQVGNKILKDDNFQTEEQFNIALIPVYARLINLIPHNSWFSIMESTGDELLVPQKGADWYDGGIWHRMRLHEWTPDESSFDITWTACFEGIAKANRTLREITTFSGSFDSKAAVTAELRCLRAWYYFILTDLFGGLPIIEGIEFDPQNPPARNTRLEVFQFIESELIAAIPDLPVDYDYGRFSKGAAQTLLAKLYLNAAVYTGTPKWQECANLCQEVINSGQYNLTTNYFDVFQPDNHTTGLDEIILPAIIDPKVLGQGMDFHMRTLHYSQIEQFNLTSQPWNGYCTQADFYNSFDHQNDTRDAAFIAGPQFNPTTGQPIVDPGFGQINLTPEVGDIYNADRDAGVRVLKYQLLSSGQEPVGDNDFVLLRFADVLLMHAEALNELNQLGEAVTIVNIVRARAYEPDQPLNPANFNQATLRQQLLKERGQELFWEGWRRQDLIRFGKFCDEWEYKPIDDDCSKRKLFPIPQRQIDANPNLEQNPGY